MGEYVIDKFDLNTEEEGLLEDDERGGRERLKIVFETLSEEVRELSLGTSGTVDRVKGPLLPLDFLRNYVMPGRPCIITDALEHWPALHKWSNEYLRSVLKDQPVSVHFTPDGRADAIVDPSHLLSTYGCPTVPSSSSLISSECSVASSGKSFSGLDDEECSRYLNGDNEFHRDRCLEQARNDSPGPDFLFVTAHVEKLLFPQALDLIVDGSVGEGQSKGVAYAQQQNGCFLSEYELLAIDAELHIPWATEALGYMPEAVNLWIGNAEAVTSFHKDHYENLYAVIAGEKHFTLLPPTDVHRMYVQNYPAAKYARQKESDRFAIVLDYPASIVPWVSVDPYPADLQRSKLLHPRFYNGPAPFTCTVRAGELLYLPSMWFHHVRQSPDVEGRTIAVNFWYDMQFDIKYAYFNMLQSVASVVPVISLVDLKPNGDLGYQIRTKLLRPRERFTSFDPECPTVVRFSKLESSEKSFTDLQLDETKRILDSEKNWVVVYRGVQF